MKRLLNIAFNSWFISVIPLLIWIFLSILIDPKLINVLSVTYPLVFLYSIILNIFAQGANIESNLTKNKESASSGYFFGILITIIIGVIGAVNAKSYTQFMHMYDVVPYEFVRYSIILLTLTFTFAFILINLYYDKKAKLSTFLSIFFNLSICIGIIIAYQFFHNYHDFILLALILPLISILLLHSWFIKQMNIISLKKIRVIKWFRNNSAEVVQDLFFFFLFLVGFRTVFTFSIEFALVISFITIVSDASWDASNAITTNALIDISSNRFNYKKHRKNAFILTLLLSLIILIMTFSLMWLYELNIYLLILFLSVEFSHLFTSVIYQLKTCQLQLNGNAKIITTNKVIANVLRTICSFLPTPFCTLIGQVISFVYQFISVNIIYRLKSKTSV